MDNDNQLTDNPFYATLDTIDVFTLLGMTGSQEDKDAYLEQMQQAVWTQVVEEEILPTLSSSQLEQVDQIMDDENTPVEELKGKIFAFLLQTTPNLSELMKEKILEFKAEILVTRLDVLREKYAANPSELQRLDSLEAGLEEGNVQMAVDALATM